MANPFADFTWASDSGTASSAFTRSLQKLIDNKNRARLQAVESINKNFVQNPVFKMACELAGVYPSVRQASKYRNRKGQAYCFRLEALKKLNISKGRAKVCHS
jgi:hypothetical protein